VQKGARLWDELFPAMERIFGTSNTASRTASETTAPPAPKVLLVDDDAVVLKGLTSRLEKAGLRIVTASSGMQAFWLALKERPDAIVTDYYMAGGDGHYLLSRIKSTPATNSIPVIVCTGKVSDPRDRMPVERDVRGRGQAADFLTKPVTAEDLLQSLRRRAGLLI
jgi:CheY-like chemotaxis protein